MDDLNCGRSSTELQAPGPGQSDAQTLPGRRQLPRVAAKLSSPENKLTVKLFFSKLFHLRFACHREAVTDLAEFPSPFNHGSLTHRLTSFAIGLSRVYRAWFQGRHGRQRESIGRFLFDIASLRLCCKSRNSGALWQRLWSQAIGELKVRKEGLIGLTASSVPLLPICILALARDISGARSEDCEHRASSSISNL